MSLSQNRNVSSIAKKLTREMRRKKMRAYRLSGWLIIVFVIATHILTWEYAKCGEIRWGANHYFVWNDEAWTKFSNLVNHSVVNSGVSDKTGFIPFIVRGVVKLDSACENIMELDEVIIFRCSEQVADIGFDGMVRTKEHILYDMPILMELIIIAGSSLVLLIVERILCAIAALADRSRIKSLLKPIMEIVVKADEFTRSEFDDSKYQHLEETIASLDVEESLPVTTGDKELMGLENAINNLLMRMRESNMQQARFVNDASHELRTPIAVIEGYANMLARWGREDEKVLDESITAIQHESAHMKYLIEQLLFLARGDSGKTVLKFEDVSLKDMMREIYEESLMIDENHVYKFNCPEEDVTLNCDPTLLKQAVRILVDNAAKYTKEKDEITISVGRNDKDRPYLQVDDTGIGMAESDVAHMFERFYRSDEVRTFKGTGLGLSIAKWIVDKHEGYFEVVSREEIGTRIRIVL